MSVGVGSHRQSEGGMGEVRRIEVSAGAEVERWAG